MTQCRITDLTISTSDAITKVHRWEVQDWLIKSAKWRGRDCGSPTNAIDQSLLDIINLMVIM